MGLRLLVGRRPADQITPEAEKKEPKPNWAALEPQPRWLVIWRCQTVSAPVDGWPHLESQFFVGKNPSTVA